MAIAKKPIIWTISGSDCSGGAGIAADIKTGHALGVEVCHLITANTVQNSHEFTAVNPVDVNILEAQWDALLEDKPPRVIKIGLLANDAQAHWLYSSLALLKQVIPRLKVIYDPVGSASVGGILTSLSKESQKHLFKCIDILTPNALEAISITQNKTSDVSLMAELLVDMGCHSVVIKGGHLLAQEGKAIDECTDYCLHTLNNDDSNPTDIIPVSLLAARLAVFSIDFNNLLL